MPEQSVGKTKWQVLNDMNAWNHLDKVKATASFICTSAIRGSDQGAKGIDVSVPRIENEKAEETFKRLEAEARDKITNCYRKQFMGLGDMPPALREAYAAKVKSDREKEDIWLAIKGFFASVLQSSLFGANRR